MEAESSTPPHAPRVIFAPTQSEPAHVVPQTALVSRSLVAVFTLAFASAWHWVWPGWVAGFVVGVIFASVVTGSALAWLVDTLYSPEPGETDEREPVFPPVADGVVGPVDAR